jgi:hypothetical protein
VVGLHNRDFRSLRDQHAAGEEIDEAWHGRKFMSAVEEIE